MKHETNDHRAHRDDDEPRDDTPSGRAYWREYARAEQEHADQLRDARVRANVLRATFGSR